MYELVENTNQTIISQCINAIQFHHITLELSKQIHCPIECSLNPDFECELHSLYYSDQESYMTRANGEPPMLNLNVGGINSKFDKWKLFSGRCTSLLSVIILQETHFTTEMDVNYFQLLVNDFARLNRCDGIAIHVHSSFSLKRLVASQFIQNSTI